MKYLLAAYLFSAIGFFLVFLSFLRDVSQHFKEKDKKLFIPFRGYCLATIYSLTPILNSVMFYLSLKHYDLLLSRTINNLQD
jgi:hypothetical protein